MTSNSKNILLVIITAETIIIISILFLPSLSFPTKLRLSAGFFLIIKSVYLFFYFEMNHYLKEDKLLRYSLIFFPGMTSIFAGMGVLVWDVSSLNWVFNICITSIILSFLISIILRRNYLRSKKE